MLRVAVLAVTALIAGSTATRGADYGPGVTDTEIKIGNTMAYSGPASAFGLAGMVETAYFEMINAKGGVNGRKIRLISLDDAYSPGKAVEQTRKLVESEQVLAVIGQVGTVTSAAAQKYLNERKVPQILIASGAAKWDDPKNFPYSTAMYAPYRLEGRTFGKYLIANKPDARLAIFSQNDDAGRDFVQALKSELASHSGIKIVGEGAYDPSDPTVDSKLVTLRGSGADALFLMATPKFAAQAIRKVAELGWKPLTYVSSFGASVETVLKRAGLENAKDLLSAFAFKQPDDPQWAGDADIAELRAFLKQWLPSANLGDSAITTGYVTGYLTVRILEACGDNLTRENVMRQAANLSGVKAPLLLPGITFDTNPASYAPIHKLRMARFNGTSWVHFGELISSTSAR